MRTLMIVLAMAAAAAAQDQAVRLQRKIEECSRHVTERFVFFGGGSGVLISEDGYCLTNHHVAGTQNSTKVTLHTGKQYLAKQICTDGYDKLSEQSIPADKGSYSQWKLRCTPYSLSIF